MGCFFGLNVYLRIICTVLDYSFSLRIICTVLNCFFGLTVCIFVLVVLCSTISSASQYVSSYYLHRVYLFIRPYCMHHLHCAQLLIRPRSIYLRIIYTVLDCFFSLTVLSSYYLYCVQLLLRPHSMYLRIICTMFNTFFGLSADPTAKRAVIYPHLSENYSYKSWNLETFILKKRLVVLDLVVCVFLEPKSTRQWM
jgi:hypothetical protein